MRIVATACLVLAILFMVGCGTSAEDKKAITDNTAAIGKVQKDLATCQGQCMDMAKKIETIETFLKSKYKDYGVEPAKTEVKPTTPMGKETPAKTAEPAKTPEKTKEAPKTK